MVYSRMIWCKSYAMALSVTRSQPNSRPMGDFGLTDVRQHSLILSSKHQMREYLLAECCSSFQYRLGSFWWPNTKIGILFLFVSFFLFKTLMQHTLGIHHIGNAVYQIFCFSSFFCFLCRVKTGGLTPLHKVSVVPQNHSELLLPLLLWPTSLEQLQKAWVVTKLYWFHSSHLFQPYWRGRI